MMYNQDSSHIQAKKVGNFVRQISDWSYIDMRNGDMVSRGQTNHMNIFITDFL